MSHRGLRGVSGALLSFNLRCPPELLSSSPGGSNGKDQGDETHHNRPLTASSRNSKQTSTGLLQDLGEEVSKKG